ncbi:hypothetical protein AAC387_Pa01g0899 [Persea americana]
MDLEKLYMDPKDEFNRFLSSRLQRIAESNDRRRPSGPLRRSRRRRRFSFFDCLTRPTISLQSYLERIVTYTNCSPASFVAAYIYLDRFTQSQPSVPINSFNVRWLILTSVMVAAKFMDGIHNYSNSHYATIGGIKTARFMNHLEKHFLSGFRYRLYIKPSTFDDYRYLLNKEMLLESPPLPASIALTSLKLQYSEDESAPQRQQVDRLIEQGVG